MTTLTPERIEEIRARFDAYPRQTTGKDIADLLSAYDALSRDGMREALVKRMKQYLTWDDHGPGEHSDAVGANAWELMEEAIAALSPDAPRQKVEG